MEHYINQLLQDLKEAQNNKPTIPDYSALYPDHQANDPQYEGAMDYMMEWELAPYYPMNVLFGLEAEAFPPAEQLTDDQMKQLIAGILELWGEFNIHADLPEEAPNQLVYKALIDKWKNDTIQYISVGTLHVEFCDYNTADCQWGEEYCMCIEYEKERKAIPEMTPEEEANWEKGLQPNGGWINPELLDENGNFDPNKLDGFMEDDELLF